MVCSPQVITRLFRADAVGIHVADITDVYALDLNEEPQHVGRAQTVVEGDGSVTARVEFTCTEEIFCGSYVVEETWDLVGWAPMWKAVYESRGVICNLVGIVITGAHEQGCFATLSYPS